MLMRFDPFAELNRLTQQLWSQGWSGAGAVLPMDGYRSGDHYVLHFDLPGIDPASVDLTIDRNLLSVSAERRWEPEEGAQVLFSERPQGSFTRQVQLAEGLDVDDVEASYDNGVLTVRVPVAEAAKPRKVEIGAAGQARELAGAAG